MECEACALQAGAVTHAHLSPDMKGKKKLHRDIIGMPCPPEEQTHNERVSFSPYKVNIYAGELDQSTPLKQRLPLDSSLSFLFVADQH